jgi:hypothetical protein
MPFSNPIMGGPNFIRPVMQSPGFNIPSETGWAIYENGNAYFFSIVAQGTITATSFIGTDFVINSNGAFFYNGTPGAGTLSVAITSAAGTDTYGNVYYAGLTVYGNNGTNVQGLRLPTGNANENSPGYVATGVAATSPGTPYIQIVSPQSTGASESDQSYIELLASQPGVASSSQGQLVYKDNTGVSHDLLVWGLNGPSIGNILVFQNTTLPSTFTSAAPVYAGSGHIKYVGSDGSAYNTGSYHAIATGQTVSVNAFVTGISGINVAAGTYRIHSLLYCKMGTTAAGFQIAIEGPAASLVSVVVKAYELGVAGYTGYLTSVLSALNSFTASGTIPISQTFAIELDGFITFSAAGSTFALEVQENTTGDTWTINNGYLDLMPAT